MSDAAAFQKVPPVVGKSWSSTTGTLVAAILLAFAAFLAGNLPLWHTDFWGHLRYGEHIQYEGLFQREPLNPFSDPTAPYLHFQWLTQRLYAGTFAVGEAWAGGTPAHRLLGGVEATRLLHASLCLVLFGLVFVAARLRGATPGVAALALLLTLVFSLNLLLYQRPQLLGAVCLVAVLALLGRAPLSGRRAAGIIGVLILWANLHGSFVVGLLLLGFWLLGRVLDLLTTPAGSWAGLLQDRQVRGLAVTLALATGGIALCNPHGPWLYLYVAQFSGHPNLKTVAEWQPLAFRWGGGGHLGWLALAGVTLLARWLTRVRFTWGERLLLLVLFGLPFLQQRLAIWLNLVLPWLLVRSWQHLRERLNEAGYLLPTRATGGATAAAVAGLLLALALQPGVRWLLLGRPAGPLAAAVSPQTPWELGLRWREQPPGTIFTAETGDFLSWALPAGSRITLTTHAHLFRPAHWTACTDALQGKPGWEKTLDDLRVEAVLLDSVDQPALCKLVARAPRWRVVQPGRPVTRLFLAERRVPLDE